ncbi:hypothetical protein CLV92_11234 [Kineococcus xinjiangensis]|uniref:Uncharacterized protein n=1 Tax=Kineococcus xinjiangensis TaxID=512762 RepID=A0A2S6IF77_9ACTN|nr:hypothetical protein [Kineococcus xinjiangensis]PPK92861.1 hypothetical protein CLV92_11234 [Kineococcus xinjiangensis]
MSPQLPAPAEQSEQAQQASIPAPRVPARAAEAPPAPAPVEVSLLGPYLGYIGYFVGAGLISGGIVHYPINPGHYLLLAAVGAAAFLGATVLNEIVLTTTRLGRAAVVRLVASSLVLSLGIGMLSGGIAHFLDFPVRSAVLVPLGILCSFVAFAVRNATSPLRVVVSRTGAGVAVLAAVTFLALQAYAGHLLAHGGGGHGHGEETTTQSTEVGGDAHH